MHERCALAPYRFHTLGYLAGGTLVSVEGIVAEEEDTMVVAVVAVYPVACELTRVEDAEVVLASVVSVDRPLLGHLKKMELSLLNGLHLGLLNNAHPIFHVCIYTCTCTLSLSVCTSLVCTCIVPFTR